MVEKESTECKKDETKDGSNLSSSTINFLWTVCLMAFIIVILLALLSTDILQCDGRIMTFLSFTSTLLSIVLSIFAVMYSFYSMQDASSQWKSVDKAVSNIKIYTETINSNNKQLLDQVISINKNIGSIQSNSSLNNNIPSNSKFDVVSDGVNIILKESVNTRQQESLETNNPESQDSSSVDGNGGQRA